MKMFLYCFFAVICLLQVQAQECSMTEHDLIDQFNQVAQQNKLYTTEGNPCSIEDHDDEHDHDEDDHDHSEEDHDEDDHDHSEEDHDEEDHDEEDHDEIQLIGINGSSCGAVYNVCREVILGLQLTTAECLSDEHNHGNVTDVSSAEAYGYGFLMVLFVSFCSLGGVFLVPLMKKDSTKWKRVYQHVYSFMIALAISALVSDAILHLIPHAFGLHAHEDESGGHDHAHEEESIDFIWKGCLVLLGIYGFYLLELALHTFGHNHNVAQAVDVHSVTPSAPSPSHHEEKGELVQMESLDSKPATDTDDAKDESKIDIKEYCVSKYRKIKPVAWLIIVGDSLHNFADGLALGAAISQSLALGVSTMFALIFHELPHEFGDFVILVNAGFSRGVALGINFLQSLGAVLGFFIGVAVSTNSDSASNWILAMTAGLFLYISLTDLLPELIHEGQGHGDPKLPKSNFDRILQLILVNLGFLTAFAILLIIAVYEEDLNTLIE